MSFFPRAWRPQPPRVRFPPARLCRTPAPVVSGHSRRVSDQAPASDSCKRREFWTHEEVDRLRELRQRGVSLQAIAAELGRSRASVNSQVYAQGLHFYRPRPPRRDWTKEEVSRLEELRQQNFSSSAVARELGRSRASVESRWHSPRSRSLATQRTIKAWSAAEMRLLLALCTSGMLCSQIALLLGRTTSSVCSKLRNEGSIHLPKPWSPEEVEHALALYKEGKTKPDIARILQRSAGSVARIIDNHEGPESTREYWTAEEDDRLLELKSGSEKLTRKQIVSKFPGRTLSAIEARWRTALSPRDQHAVPYNKVFAAWSHQESNLLRNLKERLMLPYRSLLAYFPGRSMTALVTQYMVVVRGYSRIPFTPQEDASILELRASNYSLTDIAKQLPDRSYASISGRWRHLSFRRYVEELEAKGHTSPISESKLLRETAEAMTPGEFVDRATRSDRTY